METIKGGKENAIAVNNNKKGYKIQIQELVLTSVFRKGFFR